MDGLLRHRVASRALAHWEPPCVPCEINDVRVDEGVEENELGLGKETGGPEGEEIGRAWARADEAHASGGSRARGAASRTKGA